MTIPNLGFFIDGTRADWRGRKNASGKMMDTAVKRLYLRYRGQKEYISGAGTDSRSWFVRMHETLFDTGTRFRLRKLKVEVETWRPEVVDLFGWSRGGDDAITACELCRQMGVPVRFLLLIDPVPARGWRAALRIVPFFPLQRVYKPPVNVLGGIAQVLAGEEHSRILRRAYLEDVDTYYVRGDHSDSGWRSFDTDLAAEAEGGKYGVSFDPINVADVLFSVTPSTHPSKDGPTEGNIALGG